MSVTDPSPGPRRGLRSLPWLAAFLLAAAAAVACYWRYAQKAADHLAAAEAAVDAVAPRWRLADIEADRAAVPDDRNAALVVQAADSQGRARPWSTEPPPIPYNLQPVERLTPDQTAALKSALDKVKVSLEEARKLADYSTGRYESSYAADWIGTWVEHRYAVEWVSEMLDRDVQLRAQEQDLAGALRSLRALANAGRSLGDEPASNAQIVRARVMLRALVLAERIFAQGEADDRDLAEWQRLLEQELRHPSLEISLRGDRAGYHKWLQAMEAGLPTQYPPPVGGMTVDVIDRFHAATVFPHLVKYDHARFLADITAECEKARTPWEERPGPWTRQGSLPMHGYATIAEVLQDICWVPAIIFHSTQARLRCGLVLVAAERFRLARGRWPESTAELTPEFLPQPVTDPYLGGGLLLKRLPDGIVIYSKGFNGVDDGGTITAREAGEEEGGVESDIGYRLWDVRHRRQPPPPLKVPNQGAMP